MYMYMYLHMYMYMCKYNVAFWRYNVHVCDSPIKSGTQSQVIM